MKIFINNTVELANVGSVVERKNNTNDNTLVISINDFFKPIDEVERIFSDIKSIKIVRKDLNDVEQAIEFTNYTVVDKIERKMSDISDTTLVTLIENIE